MRIPDQIKKPDNDIKTITRLISDIPDCIGAKLQKNDKLIKRIERIVRQSIEYKDLRNYLRDEMDFNRCLLLSNIDYDMASIELHHSVFTLYDVVDIVTQKHETIYKHINVFDIANEVMKIHYEGLVPLTPLTETVHQLVHNDEIFIPFQILDGSSFGNRKLFIEAYKDYMSTDQLAKYNSKIKYSNEVIKDYSVPILERKFTYLKVDGFTLPKYIELDNEDIEEIV